MKKRKIVSLIIASLILLGSVTPATAATVKNSDKNKLVAISLDGIDKPAIDITLGNNLPLTGYFTRNVQVGDKTRTVKIYVAPGTSVRDYFTVITVPEGMTTEVFLKKSRWIDIANEKSEGLFILEPGKNGWGSTEDELDYINEAYKVMIDKTYYNTFGEFYLAGYGKGGTALQAWAMQNPLFIISSAFVGTNDLSKDFIEETGSKTFKENEEISYSEVPVPVWFVNSNLNSVKNVVDYWKNANDCVFKGSKLASLMGSTVFMQDKNSDSIVTSYSDVLSKVAVLRKNASSYYSSGFTNTVYDFLSYYTRYDNTSINGNVLGVRPDYEAMDLEIKQMDVDGYTRDYLVYVPKSAPKENIPVVYVMAGNTQTCRVFFDATHWWEVADKYGFMLVFPSEQYSSSTEVTWNLAGDTSKSDDFKFLEEVIKQIDMDYKTDHSRRYLTGQSLGSMMTNYVSMVMPKYFAAIGSTSGPIMLNMRPVGGEQDKLPAYLFMGEYDLWSWDFNIEGQANDTVNYWLERNELGEIEDAVVTSKDRYTTYTWYDDNDIPMYKFTQTSYRSHNCIVSEMWTLWEDWFSKWEIDENGIRNYK